MFKLKLVLIFCGFVFIYLAFEERRLAQFAKSAPSTITCADLAAKGPGDNAYVTLTEYELGSNFVYETGSKMNSGWTLVYVPAVPKHDLNPLPQSKGVVHPRVIIKSNAVETESDLPRIAGRLEGMVINEIRSLSGQQKRLLLESYPGTNLDTCWIVEHGRRPAGLGKVFALAALGVALSGSGIGLFFVRRKAKA
ncbi:MAG: hypothetical protein ABSH20_00665 [Tepidisphaeraceae bacterium]